MRFAAIADVHGNYLALEAVLADIRAQGIGEIVNLGDMASGPLDARRTMDALMSLDAVHVLGNHDRWLIDRPVEKMGSWDRAAYAQLGAGHLDWLRTIPPTCVFRDQVFLCHAAEISQNRRRHRRVVVRCKLANGLSRCQLCSGQAFAKLCQGFCFCPLDQANENVIQHTDLGFAEAIDVGQEQARHLLQDLVTTLG